MDFSRTSSSDVAPRLDGVGSRTTILLIRHAHTDAVGRYLAGRTPGVALSAVGRAQVKDLLTLLCGRTIDAVYSGPLERARETATPLAASRGLPVHVRGDLDEVDFGAWTGRTFDELALLPEWKTYNTSRSTAVVPGGEDAATATTRIVRALAVIRSRHPCGTAAVVTHAELIRYAMLHALGWSPDRFSQVEIAPASVHLLRHGPAVAG